MNDHADSSYSTSNDDPDDALAARIAAGDAAAIEELLEKYMPRLRAFVRLRLGPRLSAKESASDIVQSACRDVLGRIDQFQHGGARGFRAWMFNAAARKIADRAEYWGAQRRDPAREMQGEDEEILGCYSSMGSPSERSHNRDALDVFERAFAQLSEGDREVIVLSRVVGLSRKQIAEELACTEATIRNRLPRALARFASILDEDEED